MIELKLTHIGFCLPKTQTNLCQIWFDSQFIIILLEYSQTSSIREIMSNLDQQLQELISQAFDKDEFIDLCKTLSVNYENLSGDILRTKISKLIGFMVRRGRLAELIETCSRERPHLSWPIPSRPKTSDVRACPTDLEDFINKEEQCARIVQRETLIQSLAAWIEKEKMIVLSGHPMVGKSRLMRHLSSKLNDDFVPLMIDAKTLVFNDIDDFAYSFVHEITRAYHEWAEPRKLSYPPLSDFRGGQGESSFWQHWQKIMSLELSRKLVLIIDEIDVFLDIKDDEVSKKISDIFRKLLQNPQDLSAILVGSENIHGSQNDPFKALIQDAFMHQIGHYTEGELSEIFKAMQKYFDIEPSTLKYLSAICNGHLGSISILCEAMFSYVRQNNKSKLGRDDIGYIVELILELAEERLPDIGQRLSTNELLVAYLISLTMTGKLKQGNHVYSTQELAVLPEHDEYVKGFVDQYFANMKLNLTNIRIGIEGLAEREWILRKHKVDSTFHLKFGLFPLWLGQKAIDPTRFMVK